MENTIKIELTRIELGSLICAVLDSRGVNRREGYNALADECTELYEKLGAIADAHDLGTSD